MRETTFLEKSVNIFGKSFSYNLDTLIFLGIVALVVFLLCLWLRRGLKFFPVGRQVVLESLLNWFDDVLQESLGERGRVFLGFIVTLFLFVLISNWMGIIPGFLSPTRDINVCLGLSIVVLIIAHTNAIRIKGFKKYLKHYIEPYWWLFPSNIFSEISKTLSHGMRLFGNIFAGGIVISLIPSLILTLFKLWGIPLVVVSNPILQAFFGIFIGGVQAFVFAILAIAYISVLAHE